MALYIPHSVFHLARLLYVRPETFGPYYVRTTSFNTKISTFCLQNSFMCFLRISEQTLFIYIHRINCFDFYDLHGVLFTARYVLNI